MERKQFVEIGDWGFSLDLDSPADILGMIMSFTPDVDRSGDVEVYRFGALEIHALPLSVEGEIAQYQILKVCETDR